MAIRVHKEQTMYQETLAPLTLTAALILALTTPALAAGQALGVKHPVFDYGINKANPAQLERAVKRIMAMSDEEVLSFVPPQNYVRFSECPNCYGGVEGNNIFLWSVNRPNELKCRYCGEVVYPNPKYPETKVLIGKNLLGEEVRFPYYLNKAKGIKHFFSCHVWMHKRFWVLNQCIALGKAYQATGKQAYAARVALVLDRFAQVFPHYAAIQNSPRIVRFCKSQKPPYAWNAGRWGNFHNEVPKLVIAAYDLTCESKEFDKLSAVRGYDVRDKLENDFFRVTYKVIELSPYHVSNVVGYDITGAAILGRVMNEPAYVHRAFAWMMRNLDEGFFFDGMWHEAPSYHYMTIGGLKHAFSKVVGYSDPPGYVDKVDGTRFDNLDPEKQAPFWARCIRAPAVIAFPNGCSSPVHDTWAGEKRSKPRDKTASTILPGYGHASLGRGEGADQMQAQLHFSGGYGHTHLDNLNLTLFAKGCEMLSDLGYTWTQMRYWTACSLAHNLVVVDRKDQTGARSDGDLLSFFPDTAGVSVVEADGKRGYHNIKGVDVYRRLLVMIPVSKTDAYVVDIFRVRGGSMHEWALHGDADVDTIAECSLPLTGNRKWMLEPGEKWKEPSIEGSRYNAYGMVRDVRRADAAAGFHVDFTYPGDKPKGVRLYMRPGGKSEVWLGRAPSVRRMGQGTRGDMRKAYDFWMPMLIVRRQGTAPLLSVFAAVEEPYEGERFIDAVERLPLTPADPNALALRVTHGNAIDTIIATLDEPPYPERTTPDGIAIKGRLGIVRQIDGKAAAAWLFEGERLTAGACRLDAETSRYSGRILAASRKDDGAELDAFIADAKLPIGDTLHGMWMIVTHGNGYKHGYEIDRVQQRDGKTLVVLTADPGLRITDKQTEEVYFPRRKIKGANTFVIPLAAALAKP